jgi:hypothetical protein
MNKKVPLLAIILLGFLGINTLFCTDYLIKAFYIFNYFILWL